MGTRSGAGRRGGHVARRRDRDPAHAARRRGDRVGVACLGPHRPGPRCLEDQPRFGRGRAGEDRHQRRPSRSAADDAGGAREATRACARDGRARLRRRSRGGSGGREAADRQRSRLDALERHRLPARARPDRALHPEPGRALGHRSLDDDRAGGRRFRRAPGQGRRHPLALGQPEELRRGRRRGSQALLPTQSDLAPRAGSRRIAPPGLQQRPGTTGRRVLLGRRARAAVRRREGLPARRRSALRPG